MKKVLFLMTMLVLAGTAGAASYSFFLGGVQVTDNNKDDILSDGGSARYDAATKTLTLTDARVSYSVPNAPQTAYRYNGLGVSQNLTVVVNGDCSIECTGGNGLHVAGQYAVTLKGEGSLTLRGLTGVSLVRSAVSTLTVDGPTLVAEATDAAGYGISGASTQYLYGTLVVTSGVVKARGAGGSIARLNTLTLGEGVEIVRPAKASFSTASHGVYRPGVATPVTGWVEIAQPRVRTDEEMLRTPLTLEAVDDGMVTVANPLGLSIGYSVNGEETVWQTGAEIAVSLTAGDELAFFGDNATYYGAAGNTQIKCSADCYLYGNIMSLTRSTNFENEYTLERSGTFRRLFEYNAYVRNHTLKKIMLPATTLSQRCYNGMFEGCTGLTEAPELPATTMAEGCYSIMFYGCTALLKAPELPATELTENCYHNMFSRCELLEKAPELRAEKLVEGCYNYMFDACTKLKEVTCLATGIVDGSCKNWLSNVSASGTFTKAPGVEWPAGVSGIPEGWTVKEDTSRGANGLSFSATEVTVTFGEEYAVPTLSNPHGLPVTYTSSNPKVATVDAVTGELTVLTAGTTVIKATFEGNSQYYGGSVQYTLTAVGAGKSPELSFGSPAVILAQGQQAQTPQLTASSGLTVVYSSSSNAVVSVDSATGLLRANGIGQAVLTATTDGNLEYKAAKAECYVTVLSAADAARVRADANGDGQVTITDAVTVVNIILGGGE